MKAFIKFILATAFILLGLIVVGFAQTDSTVVTPTDGIPGWITSIPGIITFVLVLYEALARYIPTNWNLSLIDLVIKLLKGISGTIAPNKATTAAVVNPDTKVEVKGDKAVFKV